SRDQNVRGRRGQGCRDGISRRNRLIAGGFQRYAEHVLTRVQRGVGVIPRNDSSGVGGGEMHDSAIACGQVAKRVEGLPRQVERGARGPAGGSASQGKASSRSS